MLNLLKSYLIFVIFNIDLIFSFFNVDKITFVLKIIVMFICLSWNFTLAILYKTDISACFWKYKFDLRDQFASNSGSICGPITHLHRIWQVFPQEFSSGPIYLHRGNVTSQHINAIWIVSVIIHLLHNKITICPYFIIALGYIGINYKNYHLQWTCNNSNSVNWSFRLVRIKYKAQ